MSLIISVIVPVVLLILIIMPVIAIYNSLISSKNTVKNAWAVIDTQLKRRYDLIPNLIETVKGYMEHEKTTLTQVMEARNSAMSVQNNSEAKAAAENQLTNTLKSLFAVSENYPDLKANQNFLALQEELVSTENKISYARIAYNDAVMFYSNKKEQFPSNIIASMFNFEKFEYFEAGVAERENVKVSFK